VNFQVDVGTSSVRAGLVQKQKDGGKLLKYHSELIKVFKLSTDNSTVYFEQSSDDIWSKVCACVRKITSDIADKSQIAGIGFDATCSLVLLDNKSEPLTVSVTGNSDQNIIMWMDHRAHAETALINAKRHQILNYVGGKVSLEMEVPKLLWLKRNLSESYEKIGLAFDLPDFLTFKATGSVSRSICSLTCKWNYDASACRFPRDYFESLDLHELCDSNFQRIGGDSVKFPGAYLGNLTDKAAHEMGLSVTTAVGCSMIDAHAGALGLLGSSTCKERALNIDEKLILIAGTSTCHMSVTSSELFSPGIWGPYKHALVPDLYLHEGGQSATGMLIDFIVNSHPKYGEVVEAAGDTNIHDYLHEGIVRLAEMQGLRTFHELTRNFHIYPDFHGNRSPVSDSSLTGMISGMTMHDSLFVTYLAAVQALAYQTKHIIDSLYASGRKEFRSILICGGMSKNRLFVQTNADVCRMPVLISNEPESVLLGAAMLGATASGAYGDLRGSIEELSNDGCQVEPCAESFDFHAKKYKVFLKMLDDQRTYRDIMEN
jgi:FGGY-family pentulose kinase